MATNTILRILYLIISLPFLLISFLFYILNIRKTREYFNLCLEVANIRHQNFDECLIHCLYLGEDKRNNIHYGVDFYGIIRALLSTFRGNIQGASTIEQQFVRTVTGRYDKNVSRKIEEQILALLVSIKLSKKVIAESYLSIAFFGTSMNGYIALCCNLKPQIYDLEFYAKVIARLKYPQPSKVDTYWKKKVERRSLWIIKQYKSIEQAESKLLYD